MSDAVEDVVGVMNDLIENVEIVTQTAEDQRLQIEGLTWLRLTKPYSDSTGQLTK